MSAALPTPERSIADTSHTASPASQPSKPQRVLACVLCQKRKVKCDRKFPCANCIRHRVRCVPAALVRRPRRRRFPERELLERLRKYEDLLRQNDIEFEPLHKDPSGEGESPNVGAVDDSDDEQPSTTVKPERVYDAKNFWHAMNQGFRDHDNDSDSSYDDVREAAVAKVLDQAFQHNDHLLLGSSKTAVNLSALHPDPAQIFRLWQVYLDNVDPLLKVTHNPSLQSRIIEAVSNVANIDPTLEALMFSIYCMSVQSLAVDDCQAMFASSKEDLLTRYQFGCQQALSNCGFLQSGERNCLTALYLYLVSVGPSTHPRALSSMLGVAIRIAQRMSIHSESACAKFIPLEAEMRRRLWWSLILFDNRISEMADYKCAALAPTWDCRIPLNVNDSDLRPEMKEPPKVQGKSTQALFAVVRSELGEFVRHSAFHLDFTSPALKPVVKDVKHSPITEGEELVTFEKMIEDKHLKFCNPENPLHFMTIWMTRAYLAKCRLVEHYSRYSRSSVLQKEPQRDAAIFHAFSMLECDTKIMNSPLTKGYLWLVNFHFPFLAYIHVLLDLRRRPVGERAERAWEVISDNYEAGLLFLATDDSPLFSFFTKIILQAWEARTATFGQSGDPSTTPRIVSDIERKMAQAAQNIPPKTCTEQPSSGMAMGLADFQMSMAMGFEGHNLLYSMGGQESQDGHDITGQVPLNIGLNQLNWEAIDWGLGESRGW